MDKGINLLAGFVVLLGTPMVVIWSWVAMYNVGKILQLLQAGPCR